MKNISKILAVILAVLMILSLSACGPFTNSEDLASNAQKDAEQMADDIINELEKWEQFEEDVETKLDSDIKTNGPYEVVRVVDGDTFIADVNGVETKFRLIGVDTPESVATGKNAYKNCEEGKEASNYTKSLIEGKSIMIEYDVDKDDDYNRKLAYVYLSDGTMLNKHLLEQGYARMMTVQPNVKYVDEFKAIQTTARENKVGFWKDFELWFEE